MTETFDITPRGMTTDEGVQRVNAAVKAAEEAAAAVANAATEFFREQRATLREVARGESLSMVDRKALSEALDQMEATIEVRASKHDALLRAVAGHPAQEATQ